MIVEKVIILGDFLDTSGFAYKRFVDILETLIVYNILTSQHIIVVIYLII